MVDALEDTYSGSLAEEVSQGSVLWVADGLRAIYDISDSLDDDVVSSLMIDLTGSVSS